jgi:hypothetical protein
MAVGHGHHQGGAFRNAIHDAMRKSPKQEPSRLVAVSRPGKGKTGNLVYRRVDLISERCRRGQTRAFEPRPAAARIRRRASDHGMVFATPASTLSRRRAISADQAASTSSSTSRSRLSIRAPASAARSSAGRLRASSSSRLGSLTNQSVACARISSPKCLQNCGRIQRIPEDGRERGGLGNLLKLKPLRPEVARHQPVGKSLKKGSSPVDPANTTFSESRTSRSRREPACEQGGIDRGSASTRANRGGSARANRLRAGGSRLHAGDRGSVG